MNYGPYLVDRHADLRYHLDSSGTGDNQSAERLFGDDPNLPRGTCIECRPTVAREAGWRAILPLLNQSPKKRLRIPYEVGTNASSAPHARTLMLSSDRPCHVPVTQKRNRGGKLPTG